ncbi:MAG: gamma-glutamylcyclotransferase [Stenomitos frigidus ULC029]
MMFHVFVYGTLKPGESNHRLCATSVLEARPTIAQTPTYLAVWLPFYSA